MAFFFDRRSRELSRFEAVLALVVILLIGYLLAGRLDALLATVEKSRLSTAVAQMNTGLKLAAAAGLMQGNLTGIAKLQGANPMALDDGSDSSWSADTGSNAAVYVRDRGRYVGAFASPDPATMPPGKWYFDTDQGHLIYRVESVDYFESPLRGVKRARFRVDLAFVDKDADGLFDPGTDSFRSISLTAVEPYRWIQ